MSVLFIILYISPFSALMLLVGRQEGHLGPYARRGRKSYSRTKIDLRRTSVYAGMHDADLALVRRKSILVRE